MVGDEAVGMLAQIGGLIFLFLGLVIVGEALYLTVVTKQENFRHHYFQVVKNLGFVGVIGFVLGRAAPVIAIGGFAFIGQQVAPWQLPFEWYGWIAGLLVYEFWYWLQHMMGHKVRLFWCVHAPHHAPDTIQMAVGANHHALESLLYFPIFFGLLPALCGVPPEMIIAINLVDVLWGSLLHISPKLVPWRYGPLEYFMQTPRYHRVHHAKNLIYMDKNYNSITLFWDWVMGTLQPLQDDEPAVYGITRDVDVENFRDVQFGEFAGLWRDVKAAPGLGNKLRYIFMPPGWSHTGDHKMVRTLRAQAAQQAAQEGLHDAQAREPAQS